jgi:hypothetical protein
MLQCICAPRTEPASRRCPRVRTGTVLLTGGSGALGEAVGGTEREGRRTKAVRGFVKSEHADNDFELGGNDQPL